MDFQKEYEIPEVKKRKKYKNREKRTPGEGVRFSFPCEIFFSRAKLEMELCNAEIEL